MDKTITPIKIYPIGTALIFAVMILTRDITKINITTVEIIVLGIALILFSLWFFRNSKIQVKNDVLVIGKLLSKDIHIKLDEISSTRIESSSYRGLSSRAPTTWHILKISHSHGFVDYNISSFNLISVAGLFAEINVTHDISLNLDKFNPSFGSGF